MKTVYVESAWTQPLFVRDLVLYPPDGYCFVAEEITKYKIIRLSAQTELAGALKASLANKIPLGLVLAYLRGLNKRPQKADLTYAISHLILRRQPWVLDMLCELPNQAVASTARQFDRYKATFKKAVASPYCKKIICWVKAGKKALISCLGSELEEKIEVVYWGVPRRNFVKKYDNDRVKLLFVNSGNINTSAHFIGKGGNEVLEAFFELSKHYSNLELVVRSGMPKALREKYCRVSNIKIIDKPIPWEQLEREWKSADIFVLPTRITPGMVFLDAMSYELPIVTTDVWANSELVQDGRTGFLVSYPAATQYIKDFVIHFDLPEYKRAVSNTDAELVKALVKKLSILIEDPELRRKMGKEGRHEVEHGRFSLQKRNAQLKKVLDEITQQGKS